MNNRIKQALEQPAQQEPERVKFERHWRKTRGEKKSSRELPRHPLQPQTYIQDSANRHWVTWQAAVRSVAPPAQQEPVAFLVDGDLYYPEEIDWETLQEQGHTVAPLYTSPPAQRKPLTDEQIDKLPWGPHEGNPVTFAEGLRDFARAIEAAHGIKENT